MTLIWRSSRIGLFSVFFFGAFVNLLKFAMPLYLLQVLDRVPASRSVETLILITMIVIVAITAGAIVDAIRRRMLARWGIWIERRLAPELVRRGFSNGVEADFQIERLLRHAQKLRVFAARRAVNWFDIIWAPAFVLGTFLVHPYLGLLSSAAIALVIIVNIIGSRVSAEARRSSSVAHREATNLVDVASRNRESVGALGMSENLASRWIETSDGRLTERERIETHRQILLTVLSALKKFVSIGMIGLGMWLVVLDQLTLGGIFAARVMSGFAYNLVSTATRGFRDLIEARGSYVSVRQVLEAPLPKETEVHPRTASSSLRFQSVTHRYSGQRADLYRRLSFELNPGQLLLVRGRGGVGKSTLSRLAVGLTKPRFGKVFLGDTEIVSLPDKTRNEIVGFLPQHTEIFSGTVRENIARLRDGPLDEVVKAAKLAGIHDFILELKHGYETQLVPDTFDQFSGSQRKRIALARSLYKSPRLLVLDEPSANLDSPSRRFMEASIQEMRDQGAIVIVTQSIRSSRLERMADKHLELADGTFTITDKEDMPKKDMRKLRRVK